MRGGLSLTLLCVIGTGCCRLVGARSENAGTRMFPMGCVPSPDGRFLAVDVELEQPTQHLSAADLFVSRVDGTQTKRLTFSPTGGGAGSPAWSADGRWIAYSTQREVAAATEPPEGRLALVTADGRCTVRDPLRLVGYRTAQAWSADGRTIAVGVVHYDAKSLYTDIWRYRQADGTRKRIARLTGEVRSLTWSPNGKRIAAASYSWSGSGGTFYVMEANDGRLRELQRGLSLRGAPFAWSPDSRRLVFGGPESAYVRAQGDELWIADASGNRRRRLGVCRGALCSLCWPSASGPLAAVETEAPAGNSALLRIGRVSLRSGRFSPLSSGPGHTHGVSWSRDGAVCAYVTHEGSRSWHLRVIDLKKRAVRAVNLQQPVELKSR